MTVMGKMMVIKVMMKAIETSTATLAMKKIGDLKKDNTAEVVLSYSKRRRSALRSQHSIHAQEEERLARHEVPPFALMGRQGLYCYRRYCQ